MARPTRSPSSPGLSPDDEPTSFKDLVVRKLGTIYRRQVELLARRRPKSRRNRAGYALGDAASPVGIDLARLLVGSEGTLALVTEIEIKTVRDPPVASGRRAPVRSDWGRSLGRRGVPERSPFGLRAVRLAIV